QNVMLNIKGYDSLDNVIEKSMKPLDVNQFKAMAQESDAIVLDVRNQNDFVNGFIPGSIFIGIDGNFAPWVGSLIMDVNQPILLIAPEGREEEAITRLSRVGFDHVIGYLNGGFASWQNAGLDVDTIRSISPEQFEAELTENAVVFDNRKPGEYSAEHLENALNFPLDTVNADFEKIKEYNN